MRGRFGKGKLTPEFDVEKGTFQGDPISPTLFALVIEILIRGMNALFDKVEFGNAKANNMAYAIAVERLAGVKVPPRCEAIRVITAEMARISAHLMGLGAFGLDVGAWTVLLYSLEEREKLYKLFEEHTGAQWIDMEGEPAGIISRTVEEMDARKQAAAGGGE